VDKIRIGFPISITGKYSLQGNESLNGIKLWQSEVNSDSGIFVSRLNKKLPVELIYFDDESSEEKCKEITTKLINKENVDLFLGPYSSGLTLAIAPIAKRLNRIVWNYGGATDEITERGYTNFINAIAPCITVVENPLLVAKIIAIFLFSLLSLLANSLIIP